MMTNDTKRIKSSLSSGYDDLTKKWKNFCKNRKSKTFLSIKQEQSVSNITNLRANSRENMARPNQVTIMTLLVIVITFQCQLSYCLDCFVCQSRNGSNPDCEDPFHNLNPVKVTSWKIPDKDKKVFYHTPCYTSRKNREGLFPASACLKLSGTYSNGENLVIRQCAVDSGTLNQDTEIVRMSHCGAYQLDGEYIKGNITGCVLACTTDACNGTPRDLQETYLISIVSILLTLFMAARALPFDRLLITI